MSTCRREPTLSTRIHHQLRAPPVDDQDGDKDEAEGHQSPKIVLELTYEEELTSSSTDAEKDNTSSITMSSVLKTELCRFQRLETAEEAVEELLWYLYESPVDYDDHLNYLHDHIVSKVYDEVDAGDRKYLERLEEIKFVFHVMVSESGQAPTPAKDEDCSVCLEPLMGEKSEKRGFLPCLHIFHTRCITRWNEYAQSCPICRYVPDQVGQQQQNF